MAATPESHDARPLLIFWLLALPALLLVLSGGRRTFRGLLPLPASGQAVLTTPFELTRGWFGAPKVQLTVRQPINTSSAINAELLDDKNNVVLSYYKDTWRQTGTWSEGGESGTWDEQDSEISTEFRPGSTGQFRLRLSLEDYLTIANRGGEPKPRTGVLPVVVEIYANTLNPGLLVSTCFFLLVGIGFYLWFEYASKRSVSRVTRQESTLMAAIRCPAQALIKLTWSARYEEPDKSVLASPVGRVVCPLNLGITDAWGTALLQRQKSFHLEEFQIEEDERGFKGSQTIYLRLKASRRLSVRVEVPNRLERGAIELERLSLTLTELTKTIQPVTVELL